MCPVKPVSALESAPSEQQNSPNLHGNALVQLCDLMKEQNQILRELASQLSLMMQTMAEDQGNEDGGFTSLEQTSSLEEDDYRGEGHIRRRATENRG